MAAVSDEQSDGVRYFCQETFPSNPNIANIVLKVFKENNVLTLVNIIDMNINDEVFIILSNTLGNIHYNQFVNNWRKVCKTCEKQYKETYKKELNSIFAEDLGAEVIADNKEQYSEQMIIIMETNGNKWKQIDSADNNDVHDDIIILNDAKIIGVSDNNHGILMGLEWNQSTKHNNQL